MCVPDILGVLAVWIQNPKKNQNRKKKERKTRKVRLAGSKDFQKKSVYISPKIRLGLETSRKNERKYYLNL